ncbi:SIMPL domain-containing protein [Candidatus Parcubacteria bacterium]|nr:SIMPL domain-containing protein [Candidatus Parcubacteria bacterium]
MNEYFEHEEVKRFFKWATVVVVLLGIFLLFKSLNAFKDWRSPSAAFNTIVVTGHGEAFATPDVANFTFTVSADASSVGGAQDTVTQKTNSIMNALKELGIEEKDIRTTDYSVYPKYTYQPVACSPTFCPPSRQIPDGYTVTHSVEVKVRKTDDAGKALAAAGAKGATNISSLAFTIDDPESIMNEARDEAVKEAREKAKTLAKSLGVRLGRVVDFNDSTYNPGPYPVYKLEAQTGAADTSSAPSLPAGQNKITSNVSVTYEIR